MYSVRLARTGFELRQHRSAVFEVYRAGSLHNIEETMKGYEMLNEIESFADGTAYWLMAPNNILTTQRLDPIVTPGKVSTHVHSVLGGSGFGLNVNTSILQESECTSIPIQEDKSNYWFPQLYFQKNDGSFASVSGNAVICRCFPVAPDSANVTAPFPNNFRMLSGDTTLRTLNASSFAQQAVTFLCLQFSGTSKRYNELPVGVSCPAGIRSQINFPSCWDGKNIDSEDHKLHVAFLSTGPDNGTCDDPRYPVILPRIFMEVYWISQDFEDQRDQALTPSQPFFRKRGSDGIWVSRRFREWLGRWCTSESYIWVQL
ncbi:wsc domain [Lentinula edodes]|uniref:Wsc domain n=1 Tax=Lentinula edodes TaxID=5353 RepID=A0A1Q3DZS8_LENED|nr:wsc domain [Lentinula edodes]